MMCWVLFVGGLGYVLGAFCSLVHKHAGCSGVVIGVLCGLVYE